MPRTLRSTVSSLRRTLVRRRRLIAALCAALAAAATLQALAGPSPPEVEVVVAAHDLPAGAVVQRDDLTATRFPRDLAPAGHLSADALIGRVLTAPVVANEALTRARVTGAAALTPAPGEVAVPVRLPDAGVVALLRVGDEVDLIATDPQTGQTHRVARQVRVVALPETTTTEATITGRLIVVAARSQVAEDIAEQSVMAFLTVAYVG